jgi:hypothetical protein
MANLTDSWRSRDACVGMPTALFFPDTDRPEPDATAAAVSAPAASAVMTSAVAASAVAARVCATCPVRVECLAAGERELHGIWGGLTVAERRSRRDTTIRVAA